MSDEADRLAVRHELATDANAVVIVQASRSEPWKGHRLLLDALARLSDVPGWIWWQVGGAQRAAEQNYLDELRETAARHGIAARVRFVGERPDVARLFAAADIHCQANRDPEPFGIAFVEALAAGLPVVTMAMGGALEIVDESCGLLVPPGDVIALSDALRRLIADPALRSRLASAGPARARQVADPAVQIRQMHEALQRMSVPAHVNLELA